MRLVGKSINPETLVGDMKSQLEAEKLIREGVYPLAKKLRHTAELTLVSFFSAGDMEHVDTMLVSMSEQAKALVEQIGTNPKTAYLLSLSVVQDALSDAQALENLVHFIQQGHLAVPRSSQSFGGLPSVNDSVYLNGIIKTCRSLERYAVGRATHGDRASVKACSEFVSALLQKLMEFDFRNGPLRRAYDGVKYAHKRLGDILYETSLCQDVKDGDVSTATFANDDTSTSTRIEVSDLLPVEELETVRIKMVAFDEKREQVIKRCRDVQKLSKQAIFSLHRNEKKKARNQLNTAMSKAQAISEEFDFATESELRSGSFQNAMEEWVEGRLFEAWLDSDSVNILSPTELQAELTPPLKMTHEEYLGGLVDFTGEVGRWAVLKATQRNKVAVEKALAADLTVEASMILLGTAMPGKMNKKSSALRNNVKKLEHVLYELSLLKGTGRKTFTSAANKPGKGSGDDDDGNRGSSNSKM
jgi:predicted translin family RNA/ssDNA-binding protein